MGLAGDTSLAPSGGWRVIVSVVSAAVFGGPLSYCQGGRRSGRPLDGLRHEQ